MIAVVGATGNVGRKIVEILLHRGCKKLALLASSRSKGMELFGYGVEDVENFDFTKCKIVLFATDSDISRQYIPHARQAGCVVIDSSSAFRLHEDVPLIVPPVNGFLVGKHSLYSTANCLASPLSVVLMPLHKKLEVKRVIVTTFQSTSGAGKEPMDELFSSSGKVLMGEAAEAKFFPRPIAFNVIPQVDKICEDGFTGEEHKIAKEVQKIVSGDIAIAATAVRVPVGVGHSMSVAIEFKKTFSIEDVKEILREAPGVVLSEDYATPREIAGQDGVFVGRMRRDPTCENGLMLWLVSDNLRRGAALDAVEVAQLIGV